MWYSVSFYFLSRLHFLQHDWNWRGEWGDQTCSDLCPRLGRNRLKLYNPSTGFVHLLFTTFDSSQDQNYREEYIITQDCLVGNGKMVTSWPGKGPNFSLVTRSPDLKFWFWKLKRIYISTGLPGWEWQSGDLVTGLEGEPQPHTRPLPQCGEYLRSKVFLIQFVIMIMIHFLSIIMIHLLVYDHDTHVNYMLCCIKRPKVPPLFPWWPWGEMGTCSQI